MPNANIETITNLYLYGTETKPESIEDRLRDVASDYTMNTVVNTTSYMNNVGIYATSSRAKVVTDFFHGNISSSLGITDASGVTRLLLSDYLSQHPGESSFTVSQYSTDVTSANFKERAYIWGTTEFSVSPSAILVWDHGDLRIDNIEIRPLSKILDDENFDFVSPNPAVQAVSDTILKPAIDAYDIGRKIEMEFDTSSGHFISSYSAANFSEDDTRYPSAIPEPYDSAIEAVGILAAAESLIVEAGRSVDYYFDGRFIIYGSQNDDTLSVLSAKGPLKALARNSGLAIVSGAGNDVVTGSDQSDYIYGGNGQDSLNGGAGNDFIKTEKVFNRDTAGWDTIMGGSGDDMIVAHFGDLYGGDGADQFWFEDEAVATIHDLSPEDSIYWLGHKLVTPVVVLVDTDPYGPNEADGYSDGFTAYMDEDMNFEFKLIGTSLIVRSSFGELTIDNFQAGQGGLQISGNPPSADSFWFWQEDEEHWVFTGSDFIISPLVGDGNQSYDASDIWELEGYNYGTATTPIAPLV